MPYSNTTHWNRFRRFFVAATLIAGACIPTSAGERKAVDPSMVSNLEFADSLDAFQEREYFESLYRNLSHRFHLNGGNQENLCVLALMFHHGLGVAANREKAVLYYKYATLPRHYGYGYSDYAAFAGLRELTGSPIHDIRLLTRKELPAVETAGLNAEAMYRKAQMHFHGICAPLDNDLGQAWLLQAAGNGHAEARLEAAANYITGRRIVVRDAEAALELLAPLESEGNARALELLGDLHNQGDSDARDAARVREYYDKALENSGEHPGSFLIAKAIASYEKSPEDTAGREKRLGELRALGEREKTRRDERAKSELVENPIMQRYEEGVRHFDGDGVPVDYYRAAMLFGNADGVAADPGASGMVADIMSLAFAAMSPHQVPDGAFRLGWIQEFGLCGEPNHYGAGVAYRYAAETGHAGAMLRLGMLHEEGKGVRRSPSLAREWYTAALAAGEKEAEGKLAALAEAPDGEREEWDTPEFRKVLANARFLQYMEFIKRGDEEEMRARKEWLLDAVEFGNPAAQAFASELFMRGDAAMGIDRDPDRANALRQQSMESGKWFAEAVRRMEYNGGAPGE